MLTSRSTRVRKSLALSFVLASVIATLALPAAAAAAAPFSTFRVTLGSSCLRGTAAPNTTINVTLRSSTGGFQGRSQVDTNSDGNWSTCVWGSVDPGDEITAARGSLSRTYIIQPLSFSVDRVTNVISGSTVPNSSAELFVMNCQAEWDGCFATADVDRATSSTGAFSFNFTGTYDIRGGDFTQVHWESPQGDDQFQSTYAPYLTVWLNNHVVWGVGARNAPIKVRLLDSTGVLKAKLKDRGDYYSGYYEQTFTKDGNAVDVGLNDTVVASIATDAKLKVINFHPQTGIATNVITAYCYPNATYSLYVENIDDNIMQATGVTDANGRLSVNTMSSDSWDLQVGDNADISCRNAQGDILEESFAVVPVH